MLNWIVLDGTVWKRTVYLYKKRFDIKYPTKVEMP